MTLKVLLINSTYSSIENIYSMLKSYKEITIYNKTSNNNQIIQQFTKIYPDAIFFNFEQDNSNILNIVKKISQLSSPPSIVFLTSTKKYTLQAFDLNITDYILKPVSKNRLNNTIQRIKYETNIKKLIKNNKNFECILKNMYFEKSKNTFPVWKNNRFILINPLNIIYIEIYKKNTIINTINNQFKTKYNLCDLEKKLKYYPFFRTHRSYLVNINYIKEVIPWFNNTYQLVVKGFENKKIPVSRSNIKNFKNLIGL